jgi:hypothetical protein
MACSEQEPGVDFATNAAAILVDDVHPSVLSFTLVLVSAKPVSQVRVTGLEGNGISFDDVDVSVVDAAEGRLDGYSYNGLRIRDLLVDVYPKRTLAQCSVVSLVLEVDGTSRVVEFGTPLKHDFSDSASEEEPWEADMMAVEFGSAFLNNPGQQAAYLFTATKDMTLDSIHFGAFLEPTDITYAIGSAEAEPAIFPISIRAGQSLRLGMGFSSDVATQQTEVVTMLLFDYTTLADGVKGQVSTTVVFDPVSPWVDGDYSNINALLESLGVV